MNQDSMLRYANLKVLLFSFDNKQVYMACGLHS